jgi:hypothetical protein
MQDCKFDEENEVIQINKKAEELSYRNILESYNEDYSVRNNFEENDNPGSSASLPLKNSAKVRSE